MMSMVNDGLYFMINHLTMGLNGNNEVNVS